MADHGGARQRRPTDTNCPVASGRGGEARHRPEHVCDDVGDPAGWLDDPTAEDRGRSMDDAQRCPPTAVATLRGRQEQQQRTQPERGEAGNEEPSTDGGGGRRDQEPSAEEGRAATPWRPVGLPGHDAVDRWTPLVEHERGPGWRAALHGSLIALANPVRNLHA
jgi:hypothetical protein